LTLHYHLSVQGGQPPVKLIPERLLAMKTAIRIFALSLVVAGAAAAAVTPKNATPVVSHQSAAASMPVPGCGPHMGCVASSTGN
jgi:hypothetical protein